MYKFHVTEYLVTITKASESQKIIKTVILITIMLLFDIGLFFIFKNLIVWGANYIEQYFFLEFLTQMLSNVWFIIIIGLAFLISISGVSADKTIIINTFSKKIQQNKDILFWNFKKEISYNQIHKIWIHQNDNRLYLMWITIQNKDYLIGQDFFLQKLLDRGNKLAEKLNLKIEHL